MIYKISQSSLKYGNLMPMEDSVLNNESVFCVADGITRDPTTPADFSNKKPEDVLKKYPNPSGAKLASEIFCKSFVKSLSSTKYSEEQIKNAFISGNTKIAELNKKHIKKVDYLVNDFFGCVASGGVIQDNKLYWGGICDCGIIIFSKTGKQKFQTANWMKNFINYEKEKLHNQNFNWAKPAYRKMIRSEFRNNPKKTINNNCVSYGALTGEVNANYFMNFGEIKLKKDDLVIFYTDGFEDTVIHKDFFKILYQNTKNPTSQKFLKFTLLLANQDYYKFGRERTLIAVINK